jgi:hypothetical protein
MFARTPRIILSVIAFALAFPEPGIRAQQDGGQNLRDREPLEAVIADLEGYIPMRMEEDGVP